MNTSVRMLEGCGPAHSWNTWITCYKHALKEVGDVPQAAAAAARQHAERIVQRGGARAGAAARGNGGDACGEKGS